MAPDVAVQAHGALVEALLPVPVEGDGGALDEGVAQQEYLGQHGHHQQDGGDGAPAQGLAHGADGGVGGDAADEEAGHSHDGARGEHGGEALAQGGHGGGLPVHGALELQVAVGDDDGVVDGGAHLDGAHHQIAQEEEVGAGEHGDGEVDPDGALDGEHQEHGEAGGLEGEEEDDHDEEGGEHADLQVVPGEGAGQVEGVGGVAHQEHVVAVLGLGDGPDLVQQGVGLLPLGGEVCHEDQPGPVLAPELLEPQVQLLPEVLHLLRLLPGEVHHPLVLLLQQELKDVDEGDGVVVGILEDGAVLLHAQAVGLVEEAAELDVHPGQLGELPGGEGVGEHAPILHLDVGKAGGGGDGLQGLHLAEDGPLLLIVPPGHQHGDGVLLAEGGAHLFGGHLPVGLVVEVAVVGVKDVVAPAGEDGRDGQHHQEEGGEDVAQLHHPAAPEVDVGYQVFVAGPLDGTAEEHEKAGHQEKDAQHGAHDTLGQDDAHVEADAQLHEHEGHQAGDGGEAGRGDLHDGLAEGGDVGLPGVQAVVPLLHVPVAEDDGVVDGQGQLEHHGDGVGDEGDGAEDEVGAHVEHRRRGEDDEVDGHLHVAFGGEEKDHHDDGGGDGQNDRHLLLEAGRLVPAYLGGDIDVVALQGVLDGLEGGDGLWVVLRGIEGDGEEGGRIVVVVVGLVEGDAGDTGQNFQLVGEVPGRVQRDVGDHDLGGTQGDELLVHEGEAPPGLGLRREVRGDVVVDLYLIDGGGAEEKGRQKDKVEGLPLVDDEAGELGHEGFGVLFLIHMGSSWSECGNEVLQVGDEALHGDGIFAVQPPAQEGQHGAGVEPGGDAGVGVREGGVESGLGEELNQVLRGLILQHMGVDVGAAAQAGAVE